MKKGKLIVIEGPDFAGKSTCINELFKNLGIYNSKFVLSREPGSGLLDERHKICNDIRNTLLTEKLSGRTEALLFAMSRYFHTLSIIEQLDRGFNVICDRYFISSLCYQGPVIGISQVYDYNKLALELLKDYEVYNLVFTLTYDTYKERSSYREADAMEQVPEKVIKKRLERMTKVDEDLRYLGMNSWADNVHYIDANYRKEDTLKQVQYFIEKILIG